MNYDPRRYEYANIVNGLFFFFLPAASLPFSPKGRLGSASGSGFQHPQPDHLNANSGRCQFVTGGWKVWRMLYIAIGHDASVPAVEADS